MSLSSSGSCCGVLCSSPDRVASDGGAASGASAAGRRQNEAQLSKVILAEECTQLRPQKIRALGDGGAIRVARP